MSDINDLERNKFESDFWKVAVNRTEAIQWLDDIWNKDLNDLEKDKFESDWSIRIVTAI